MESKEFVLNGKTYLAIKKTSSKYSIEEKETGLPVPNMKEIAREFLRKYGIDVSTDANVMNTYKAIRLVMDKC